MQSGTRITVTACNEMTKTCRKCKETKSIEEFAVRRKHITGDLKAKCRTCINTYQRARLSKRPGYRAKASFKITPIGKQFGRWTVIEKAGSGKKGTYWLCRCSCGVVKRVCAPRLADGSSKSCGCGTREAVSAANRKYADPTRQWWNVLFQGYLRHARARGFTFAIARDEFDLLTKRPCHYCGRSNVNKGRVRYNYAFDYNGIDRIDSSLGYIPGNVVACCGTCNTMKQRMSPAEFVAHLRLVLEHSAGI